MKKKTAILLVGAFVFTAAFSGCGKNKEATEAANESVESEDPEGKAKNSNDAEEEEKEEAKETAAADKKVGVFLPSSADDPRWSADGETLQNTLEDDGQRLGTTGGNEDLVLLEVHVQVVIVLLDRVDQLVGEIVSLYV